MEQEKENPMNKLNTASDYSEVRAFEPMNPEDYPPEQRKLIEEINMKAAQADRMYREAASIRAEAENEKTDSLRIGRAVGRIFNFCLYINAADSSYEVIRGNRYADPVEKVPDAFEYLRRITDATVSGESKDRIIRWFDRDRVMDRLRENSFITKDFFCTAANRWYRGIFMASERNEDGTPALIVFSCMDINDARETTNAKNKELEKQLDWITTLNESLTEYNSIMSSAGFGMWHIYLSDDRPPRMKANGKMAELLGIAGRSMTEEEVYSSWYDHIVPEAVPSVLNSVSEMLEGKFSENTYLWTHPTKGDIYVRCGGTAKILPDGTKELGGYHADVTDIVVNEETQKAGLKRMNREMKQQLNIIGALSNAYMTCFGLNVDTDRFIIIKDIPFVHELIKNCTGCTEAFETYLQSGVSPDNQEAFRTFTDMSTIVDRMKDTDVLTAEFKGILKTPDWYRASWIVSSRDKNGRANKLLFAVEDITNDVAERKLKEEELMKAKDAAESASKAKTSFLFNMSHDIRTPMNAIIGYTDLVMNHYDDREKCMDYLRKTQEANRFLLSLINNVLEMARIESGKTTLDESLTRTGDVATTIYSLFEEQMKKKGVEYTFEFNLQSEFILCDQQKIREIYLNLLSNAYKYTPSGGRVSIKIDELPSDREGFALFRGVIADTGIGMSADYLPHIFEEFSRARSATESRQEGTGLGMPIVRKLVDLMNGTIDVESELGKGTTFTVTIPTRVVGMSEIETDRHSDLEDIDFTGHRILMAEDNDLNAEIAMEILADAGIETERAEDGIICVDMLAKADAGYYDMILMDVQMPNLNGYEATKRIRALPDKEKADIPIIAMTANAFDEDRQNALKSGMNGHLAKPIEIPILMETLAKILK